jgi:hypothetical protein
VNKRLKAVHKLLAIGEEINREHKRLGDKKKKKG